MHTGSASVCITHLCATDLGNARTATGTATGVLGESLTGLDLSGTTHTNAGNYTDTWTFTNSNYSDATNTVNDKIGRATCRERVKIKEDEITLQDYNLHNSE